MYTKKIIFINGSYHMSKVEYPDIHPGADNIVRNNNPLSLLEASRVIRELASRKIYDPGAGLPTLEVARILGFIVRSGLDEVTIISNKEFVYDYLRSLVLKGQIGQMEVLFYSDYGSEPVRFKVDKYGRTLNAPEEFMSEELKPLYELLDVK